MPDSQHHPIPNAESAQPQSQGPSRRTLVKAAAWTVPAIAIAAPVPVFAASAGSTKNSIRAKFKAWLTAEGNKKYIDIIGKDSQHPADGYFQILDTNTGQVVTNVVVYALIDKNIPDNAWTPRNNVGDVYWKKPVKVSGPANGYWTYKIEYRTASTIVPAPGTLPLDARFHFRAEFSGPSVKVKGAWGANITASTTPILSAQSTNVADLDSNGEYVYLTSPGA